MISSAGQTQDVGATDPTHPTTGFAHLHLHSEYSLLDGGNTLSDLVDRVAALGMDAVAVTDHGNLHAAVELYTKARAAGIKPILGIEAYVAQGDRSDRTPGQNNQGGDHLVLLAETEVGWRNLLKLSSDSFLNGFYYRPRMDKSTLDRWSDGLIAINGHLGSSIAGHLLRYEQTGHDAHWQAAVEEATWHAQTFRPNEHGEPRFYIELQRHGVREQESINPHLIRLARELDLPLVCDNDVHFLRAEDYDTHDSLCCISMGKTKDDDARLRYSRELYLKSPEQMSALFEDCPEAIENAGRIAARCNVELDLSSSHAPVVRIIHPGEPPNFPGGDATEWFKSYCARFELLPFNAERDTKSPEEIRIECDRALRDLCEAGLVWRYGPGGVTAGIRARLDRELKILADKLISAYFLIVWDFVNWARLHDIPAMARGSGVGTMVGYVLGLSNACPERYGLLFERFTDPDRSEYPDIDIDICQDGRARVIDYVRQKYGHVAQIITFGRLKAKAAIKDVARVMGLAPAEGQRLANLVPNELNIRLDAALQKEPDLKEQYDQDDRVRQVVDTARALEDHARHAGVHAAGVVIATQPLDNLVPLCRATGSDDIVTQWDGPTCEGVGLLKMDFLGLRTLSTIERAKALIQQSLDPAAIRDAVGETSSDRDPLDLDRLRYDDQRVLDLFRRGDTAGVFQFESGGMRKLLLQMQPDRLEDLIAANALYRPGPMDLIPDYCARKHGKQPVPAAHPIVQQHTAETYGIMVYQEQVMQIVHGLGGIPLRQAYSLIKAISKKKHAVIDAERPRFIEGARDKGLSEREANELFDLILKFAGYGFNKSHSTGYAIIAYQTAYLKTYFPNQYMAALLTFESAARKVDDWVAYLENCRQTVFPDSTPDRPHIGVVVRPPDMNRSDSEFSVVYEEDEPCDACHGHVRFGLSAIKGVGKGAIDGLMEERRENGPFTSIFDLCERVSSRTLNKASIEALVKCGAFDGMHGAEHRASVLAAIDDAISAGQTAAEDRRNGQLNMFGGGDDPASSLAPAPASRPLSQVPPWDRLTMLEFEKQVLGFHVSGHPLDAYRAVLEEFCTTNTMSFVGLPDGTNVALGGLLSRVNPVVSRRGQKMARLTVQDRVGSLEGVVFPSAFAECSPHLQTSAPVLLAGSVDHSQGDPQMIVEQVIPIEQAERRLAKGIDLELSDEGDEAALLNQMQMVVGLLKQSHASRVAEDGRPADVVLHLRTAGKRVSMRSTRLKVVAEPHLLRQLRELLGEHNVHVIGSAVLPQSARPKRRWPRRKAEQQAVGAVG
ncbi:MAG: DNA polymerase III subunit alpha [Planctomycetota bacterium]|jgi:DNA polymerase-3 subunit alpha